MTLCRHCRERRANRPRGLCHRCYSPGIRDRYPSTSIYARRECRGLVAVPERTSDLPLPAEPCPYAPGTPEQMAVLAGRVARGEQLYHPDDRTDCEGMIGHPSRGIDPPAPQPEPWRPQYHPCRDCGSRVVDAPGERCGRCCRPRRRRPAPAERLDPSDAGLLAAWSGHDWYQDLGGEGGHE